MSHHAARSNHHDENDAESSQGAPQPQQQQQQPLHVTVLPTSDTTVQYQDFSPEDLEPTAVTALRCTVLSVAAPRSRFLLLVAQFLCDSLLHNRNSNNHSKSNFGGSAVRQRRCAGGGCRHVDGPIRTLAPFVRKSWSSRGWPIAVILRVIGAPPNVRPRALEEHLPERCVLRNRRASSLCDHLNNTTKRRRRRRRSYDYCYY